MSTAINPEHTISQVMRLVESDKRSEIRLNANGGNSILLVCLPSLENQYIVKINEMLGLEYSIIDLNELLISFVDNNKSQLAEMFDMLRGSVHQIFKSPEGETGPDLFSMILSKIENAYNEDKIPVLIHSGALYGSGIDNIHLMESELVMKSKKPLIILYPASQDGDHLLFLNSRPASKYRCMIVN
ncbi:MAG: hypothetical protein IPN79_19060 [Saprospiraceae bacterium]|jgi:hypothetical protein|nr:hypothetical protein [Saprospiraceae bacterium]MBP6624805.1 hypothetical protein [Chitinophagaceae bacterium]